MGQAKPITAAGRRRVERVLAECGLLLTQGQWEIPSVADLLEGEPVTTRGYSWDYVPAWSYSDELAERPDVARAKLFRGRTTLIAKRLWAEVHTLALGARARLADSTLCEIAEQVEAEPGIAGRELRESLGLDPKSFQRRKTQLEQRLCIFGVERDDLEHHTHESRWFPWGESKIARATARAVGRRTLDPAEAIATLTASIFPAGVPSRPTRVTTLLPALR